MQQRYSRAADWKLVGEVAKQHHQHQPQGGGGGGSSSGSSGRQAILPIIGNGDILTHYEAR